ncbi:MAG: Hsp20/alpha crystallin family protein [Planctomycetota bacterium]
MPSTLAPRPEIREAGLQPSAFPIWDPFSRLSPLGSSLNRLFEDVWPSWRRFEDNGAHLAPSLDVSEDADDVWVSVELPGMKRDNVNVQLQDGILTISGEKSESEEEKKRNYRCVERRYGRFTRSLTLPSTVAPDKIDARMSDGVLRVRLPKTAEAKARSIEVK